jgi:hypothetical protein
MSQQIFPLGDDRAGPRNAEIIDLWLEERLLALQRA